MWHASSHSGVATLLTAIHLLLIYLLTTKVKPIWILLKQETVSGSGISWAICKAVPHSRQITMPGCQRRTTQFFTGRMPFLPPNQQRQRTEGKYSMIRHAILRCTTLSH